MSTAFNKVYYFEKQFPFKKGCFRDNWNSKYFNLRNEAWVVFPVKI